MKNTEMRVHGMGPRADRALMLEERSEEARKRATDAIKAAGLSGRAWWAARDREPRRYRLMVAGDAWYEVVAALTSAGVDFEEVALR